MISPFPNRVVKKYKVVHLPLFNSYMISAKKNQHISSNKKNYSMIIHHHHNNNNKINVDHYLTCLLPPQVRTMH